MRASPSMPPRSVSSAFNVGVELGQVMLLAALVLLIALLARPVPFAHVRRRSRRTRSALTGAYLFLARSTFLFR